MNPVPKPERVIDKVRRHIQRRARTSAEDAIMRRVRREDRYCRFPLCGCGRLKLPLEVAHLEHRGMGGNPSLARTTPENLILLCRPRHRAHKFALDKKTIRCVSLTEAGARGPVRWLMDATILSDDYTEDLVFPSNKRGESLWAVLAEETAPHSFLPFTSAQREILTLLAGMLY